jgi:membrane associated rhomboid family serine protease
VKIILKMDSIQPVTLIIIALNIIISLKGFNDLAFFNKYKFQISSIQQGDKLRILSSGFLHVDQTHLLFNMLTLYFFANPVIGIIGPLNFLIIYFGSLIAGSLLAMQFHKSETYYSAVGASGAVTGILYAAVMLYPGMELRLFFAIPIPGFVFAIAYLGYSIYGMKNNIGNIGHSAHLGGAIGGYALTLLIFPLVFQYNRILVIVLAIPIILLFVFKDKFLPKKRW